MSSLFHKQYYKLDEAAKKLGMDVEILSHQILEKRVKAELYNDSFNTYIGKQIKFMPEDHVVLLSIDAKKPIPATQLMAAHQAYQQTNK